MIVKHSSAKENYSGLRDFIEFDKAALRLWKAIVINDIINSSTGGATKINQERLI